MKLIMGKIKLMGKIKPIMGKIKPIMGKMKLILGKMKAIIVAEIFYFRYFGFVFQWRSS